MAEQLPWTPSPPGAPMRPARLHVPVDPLGPLLPWGARGEGNSDHWQGQRGRSIFIGVELRRRELPQSRVLGTWR